MTREEAKEIFLSRGFIKVEGGVVFDGNKWRDACIIIFEWLKEEPKSEWEQDHAILKAYSDGANEMADKIRAEIEPIYQGIDTISHNEYENAVEQGKEMAYENVLDMIDKYKAKTEET